MVEAANWKDLAAALRDLHRTLFEHARRDYERAHATSVTAGELLNLLTSDAEFAWLRSLSELMVDLDLVREAAADERDALAATVRAAVEHVLSIPQAPAIAGAFAQRYIDYLHDDPHVAMAHAAVKRVLNAWPRADGDAAAALHERHRLAEKAAHLAKRRSTH